MNLPIGFIALALLAAKLKLLKLRTEHRIDWLGAALLSAGITALVLITTWGGNEYDWGSPQILGLVPLAVVTLALFVPVERRAAEPIMPLGLFRNRNFTLISLESLATSISSVFWWAIPFAVVVPLLAAFIKEIPLRGGPEQAGDQGSGQGDDQDGAVRAPVPAALD
ncbi:hypothetical protein [Planomonospora sp. ID67723]|uniref:hypothetical protein n=1 Tax=Planomonospora sp. ID67723 TaxID=2738134 RepID=UPI0027DD0BB5|nr:hypothetical protein [Planomonospora sp. ID67723]